MNIANIGKGGTLPPSPAKKAGPQKEPSTEPAKARGAQRAQDTAQLSQPEGAGYYESLAQRFAWVKNGSVSISGAYLDKCAKEPELAKRLEENLALYEDCVRQGRQEAEAAARAAGGKLLSYSETWSIDSQGSLTMITRGTVEYDTGIKSWEEIRKDSLERLEKARKEAASPADGEPEEEVSESKGGKVAVNQGKRARQIAAAKSRDQVQQVIALLQKDMADCKAGLEKGLCDEAEIAKVQALLQSAQARLSQVPQQAEEELGISEFELAGLM